MPGGHVACPQKQGDSVAQPGHPSRRGESRLQGPDRQPCTNGAPLRPGTSALGTAL